MGRGGETTSSRRSRGNVQGRGRGQGSDRGSNSTIGCGDLLADESLSSPIEGGIGGGLESIPLNADSDGLTESSQNQVLVSNVSHGASHSSQKTYIVPLGKVFDVRVSKACSGILLEMFSGVWPTWTKVTKSERELMWQRFQGMYEWDPMYDEIARKNWESIMGSRHGDLMRVTRDTAKDKYEAKTGLVFGTDLSVLRPFCPDWIDQANWEKMIDECWNTPSWKKVSVVNTRNRGTSSNEQIATHCGGSCSLVHTKLKMEKEKGGPVSFIEVYDAYFTRKRSSPEQPSQFVSPGASSSTSKTSNDGEVQKLKDKLAECEERDKVREERDRVREEDLKTMQEQVAILTKAYNEKVPTTTTTT